MCSLMNNFIYFLLLYVSETLLPGRLPKSLACCTPGCINSFYQRKNYATKLLSISCMNVNFQFAFFSPLQPQRSQNKCPSSFPPSLGVVLWSEAQVVLLQKETRASFQSAPRSLLIIKRRAALQAPPLFLCQRYVQFLFFPFSSFSTRDRTSAHACR